MADVLFAEESPLSVPKHTDSYKQKVYACFNLFPFCTSH